MEICIHIDIYPDKFLSYDEDIKPQLAIMAEDLGRHLKYLVDKNNKLKFVNEPTCDYDGKIIGNIIIK